MATHEIPDETEKRLYRWMVARYLEDNKVVRDADAAQMTFAKILDRLLKEVGY